MAIKGEKSYLSIFVIDPTVPLPVKGNPLIFMGDYSGTDIGHDFMATWGTTLYNQNECVVFDSLCSFGYNLKAGAKLDIGNYGEPDNYGGTERSVVVTWQIDGITTDADDAIIEGLRDNTYNIIVFDQLLNRVEKVYDGIVRITKSTEGQKKEVYSFRVERTGKLSQIYERSHLAAPHAH